MTCATGTIGDKTDQLLGHRKNWIILHPTVERDFIKAN